MGKDKKKCQRCGGKLIYEEVDFGDGIHEGNPICENCGWWPHDAGTFRRKTIMNKDFGKYIYMVEGEEKLKAWLESGHDWECYEEKNIINVIAGKWKNNHKTCNGPLCLQCGYNPCWHCEPIPTTCNNI